MKPLPAIPISDLIFWNWVQRNLANFETVSAIPTVEKLKKGDAILYESGTARRLYFNISGTIFYITVDDGDMVLSDSVITDHAIVRGDGGARRVQDSGIIIDDNDNISEVGDITFAAGGGLAFGEIFAFDVATNISISIAGKANKVQITVFNANGVSNNMTPDQSSAHITVVKAGIYLCTVSLAIRSTGGGGADKFGFSVWKNDGTSEFLNCHAHRQLAGGAGDVGSISMSGLIDLAVNDTIEVWCWNEDSTDDLVVDDITLSLSQKGGT